MFWVFILIPTHKCNFTPHQRTFFNDFYLYVWVFACMCACIPHMCLVHVEARRGHQVLWMLVSHHVCSGKQTGVLGGSIQCSYWLIHLSSPKKLPSATGGSHCRDAQLVKMQRINGHGRPASVSTSAVQPPCKTLETSQKRGQKTCRIKRPRGLVQDVIFYTGQGCCTP